MENASKALIIAGSILLSILIIALGMYIFGQAGNSTDTSQLSALEVSTFNSKFDKYKGTQTGTQVNALLDAAIANARTNDSVSERPAISCQSTDKGTVAAAAPTTYSATDNVHNIPKDDADYIAHLKTAKNTVISSHRYKINYTTSTSTDLIDFISIEY